jgi:ribosomal protein S17
MTIAKTAFVLTERGHAVQVYKRLKSVSSNFYAQN